MTIIVTDRLTIRLPQERHAEALVHALNNLNVSRWTGRIPHPYGPDDAEAFFRHFERRPRDAVILFIMHGQELIGGIGIEEGELGYWLAEPHWGKGFGTEAARAVVDHAFTELGFEQMTASYHAGNAASRGILLGLGFRETAEGRAYSKARREEVALVTLNLTRTDWANAKERRR